MESKGERDMTRERANWGWNTDMNLEVKGNIYLQDLIFTTQKIRPWNQPFQKGRFVGKKGQMSTVLPPVADGLGKDKWIKQGNDQTFFYWYISSSQMGGCAWSTAFRNCQCILPLLIHLICFKICLCLWLEAQQQWILQLVNCTKSYFLLLGLKLRANFIVSSDIFVIHLLQWWFLD